MGREAVCSVRVGTEAAEAKALLESTGVVLRGGIRRRWVTAVLQQLRVEGEALVFVAAGEPVALRLGAQEAGRWLARLQAPPPSLAAKLGIGPGRPALLIGPAIGPLDPALAEALSGAVTADPDQAAVLVAVLGDPAELAPLAERHAGMRCRALWVVHPKGPDAHPSDAEIRQVLRSRGYVDHKTSAVSQRLTATRYVRR